MMDGAFLWLSNPAPVDPAFMRLAMDWVGDTELFFIEHIWDGFELLQTQPAPFDGRDLERSISQLLEASIDDIVPGEAPYYIQHGPFERETMLPPPAQPPQYDLAFVMRADPRIMWPAEAKVLATAGALADYIADIEEQYITCRYAPFSPSGAMLAYLLDGLPSDALDNISARLGIPFTDMTPFDPRRPHRSTIHSRQVPTGKDYPTPFRCHHVVLSFRGLRRGRNGR